MQRVTITLLNTLSDGELMGHLSRRLAEVLDERGLTDREGAVRVGMPFESFRKILRGITARPRDATLQKIADGLGIPVARLVEERARDANEPFAGAFIVEDITVSEALEIAIARVNELSEDELAPVREQAATLLRAMRRESKDLPPG